MTIFFSPNNETLSEKKEKMKKTKKKVKEKRGRFYCEYLENPKFQLNKFFLGYILKG